MSTADSENKGDARFPEQDVRVLVLEDNPRDAEIAVRELQRAGMAVSARVVDTEGKFVAALREFNPSIILADYKMPFFDGAAALALALKHAPAVPFILVSGAIGEERAIEMFTGGATDYVLKNRIERLAPTVRRALTEAAGKALRLELGRKLQAGITELEQTVREWHTTFGAITDAVALLDLEARVTRCNQAMARLSGGTLPDSAGILCCRLIHGSDSPVAGCPFTKMKASLRSETMTMPLGERWVRVTCDPVFGADGALTGAVHVVADVTKEKEMDAVLRVQLQNTQLLNQIASSVLEHTDLRSLLGAVLAHLEEQVPCDSTAAYLLDPAANTFLVVARGRRNAEGAREAGVPVGARVQIEDIPFGAFTQGGQVYWPDMRLLPTSRILTAMIRHGICSAVVTQMVCQGKPVGILVVARRKIDAFTAEERALLGTVAEHCAVAIQHARLFEDLSQAYERLAAAQEATIQQERLRALGQMASGIAHDFNNTLMPILTYSDRLLDNPSVLDDKERVAHYINAINVAAQGAAAVVSRLQSFYRPREGNTECGAVSLDDIVAQSVSLTQPKWKDQAQGAGATITVRTEHDGVPIVSGNASELREALTNLVFNAVDAMPEGGVLTLRTRTGDPGHVVLEVSDTGTGMSEETRRRCLEPFYSTKGERGTGLGLAMVYGIVQRHGGTISIESELGKGTTFRMALKACVPREDRAPDAEREDARVSPLRVLVVDDEDVVREVLLDVLVADGHTVEAAGDGADGLAKFHAGTFDVVITDRAMPGMNGDQLALAIKKVAPSQPVVMLTGFGGFMQAHEELPPGVDGVIGKPLSVQALREALAAVTRRASVM